MVYLLKAQEMNGNRMSPQEFLGRDLSTAKLDSELEKHRDLVPILKDPRFVTLVEC